MASTAPLLSLDTLFERPVASIDGKTYELLLPDTLPVVDYVRLGSLRARFAAAWMKLEANDFSQDVTEEVETVLALLVRTVLKAPDAVQMSLTDAQRLSVYQAFLQLPRLSSLTPTAPVTEAKKKATGKRTGAR